MPLQFIEMLADRRITEAEREGQFANLPGAGKPLDLYEDPLIPDDLRMAYRILKNSGYVPPEVHALRELRELERFVVDAEGRGETGAKSRALRKLELLRMKLELENPQRATLFARSPYFERAAQRIEDADDSDDHNNNDNHGDAGDSVGNRSEGQR